MAAASFARSHPSPKVGTRHGDYGRPPHAVLRSADIAVTMRATTSDQSEPCRPRPGVVGGTCMTKVALSGASGNIGIVLRPGLLKLGVGLRSAGGRRALTPLT